MPGDHQQQRQQITQLVTREKIVQPTRQPPLRKVVRINKPHGDTTHAHIHQLRGHYVHGGICETTARVHPMQHGNNPTDIRRIRDQRGERFFIRVFVCEVEESEVVPENEDRKHEDVEPPIK